MPKLHMIRRHNIHQVTAEVSNDPEAQLTMLYKNQKAPDEDFSMGPKARIRKKMIFDEVGYHTLIFVAVGDLDAEDGTMRVQVIDIDAENHVVFDSGDLGFSEGFASVDVWLSP